MIVNFLKVSCWKQPDRLEQMQVDARYIPNS